MVEAAKRSTNPAPTTGGPVKVANYIMYKQEKTVNAANEKMIKNVRIAGSVVGTSMRHLNKAGSTAEQRAQRRSWRAKMKRRLTRKLPAAFKSQHGLGHVTNVRAVACTSLAELPDCALCP